MFATILTLLLAIQSAPAQQQNANDRRLWYQAYADAQKAIQDRNWQKAIADLAVAAQRGAPKPGRNVLFYGDVYRDYNPDYYLGVAYSNLQRYAEADNAFERVKQAQLISARDSLYAEFTRQATNAKGILQKQAAQVQQTAPAQTAQNPVNTRPPPNVTQTAANTQAAPAASQPPIGNVQIAQNPPANAAANTAANAVQAARPPVPDPKLVPTPATRPNVVNRPATQARADAAPARPAPAPPTPATAPLDERTGVVQFFSGDYESAAASLSAVTYSGGAAPRAYFYLACSQAAMVLTGKAPRSALDGAKAQLALANDNGQFAADKRLISPRIKQELGMQP